MAIDLATVDVLTDEILGALPLDLSDQEVESLRSAVLNDPAQWLYVEGDDPEGPTIAYYEVDPATDSIIGPA